MLANIMRVLANLMRVSFLPLRVLANHSYEGVFSARVRVLANIMRVLANLMRVSFLPEGAC